MYQYCILLGESRIVIHTEIRNCLNIFLLNDFVENQFFLHDAMYYCKRVINICLFKRKSIVEKFNGESKKVSNQLFNIYISKNDNDPKGIIIEKRDINYLDDKKTTDYMVIYENLNSSIIFLRSILIKLFFRFTQTKNVIHCIVLQ